MDHKRSPIGKFIHTSWGNLNLRCVNGKYYNVGSKNPKNKIYSNVYIEVTREEYKELCIKNKELILSLKRPSVDRINKNLNYNLSNIQFIELFDNITKDVNTVFKDGKGVCCACKQEKNIDQFVKDKRMITTGRTSRCKECEKKRRRGYYEKTGK